MFRQLNLNCVYKTEEDNILLDFYLPALSKSLSYDRAVGFFSAANIYYASQGISSILNKAGKIRYIVGAIVDDDDYEAIIMGYKLRQQSLKDINDFFSDTITDMSLIDDIKFQTRFQYLTWLIAHGFAEIKTALRPKGMYHEKIGILKDENEDIIVFTGSSNETLYAMLDTYNYESINVFKSWEDRHEQWMPHINSFHRLWTNTAKNTAVLHIPEVAKNLLIELGKKSRIPSAVEEKNTFEPTEKIQFYQSHNKPQVPSTYKGSTFQLNKHQQSAFNSWVKNKFTGILAHATGSGKTITAIYAAARALTANKRLFLIVGVPYQALADQWVDELKLFNFTPIRCYGLKTYWCDSLINKISLFNSKELNVICTVVVNKTLNTKFFRNIISKIPTNEIMFIGDECHHYGGLIGENLPTARLKLGLSATPHHWYNSDRNNRLTNYFGEIISNYSLQNALEDGVLTPYYYYPIITFLTEDETNAYNEISNQINQLIKNQANKDNIDIKLGALLSKRSRILGSASNKDHKLEELLTSTPKTKHTLFYVGEGRSEQLTMQSELSQLENIASLISKYGWSLSRFSAQENHAARLRAIDAFRVGDIDALISMRCLDEGVDLPACQTAFILASSRDPRQSIQRRGRILRKSPGKKFSTIYDFIVIPLEEDYTRTPSRNLVKYELERAFEFSSLSLNPADSYNEFKEILQKFELTQYY